MAEWDTAYVNDLPDSAFLMILPGGRKDADGKTVPRSLRMFPVRNAAGEVDSAHLRNALARIPQASSLSGAQRMAAMDKAKALAKSHASVGGPAGSYEGSAGSGRSRERMPGQVMGVQTRTFEVELELRADGDGRTVFGRAVPFGQTTDIPGGRERFMPGAFARQITAGQLGAVKLFSSHTSRQAGEFAVGKTVELAERQDGAHGAWAIYETPRGDEALHLVRTGEVTGLSVGFKAVDGGTKRGPDGAYERHAVHLDHVVLTNQPAYTGAVVTGVRSRQSVGGYRRDLEAARGILARVRADG